VTNVLTKRARVMANLPLVRVMLGDPDKVLTRFEVASILRISISAVALLTEQGKLPCFRTLGGQSRYLAIEVTRFLRGEWFVDI
jgi:hypothetical protein